MRPVLSHVTALVLFVFLARGAVGQEPPPTPVPPVPPMSTGHPAAAPAANPQPIQVPMPGAETVTRPAWEPVSDAEAQPGLLAGLFQQDDKDNKEKPLDKPKEKKWYEKIQLRGYTQFRINETTSHNEDLADPHYVGDRSIGENQSFLIRRARLIFSGDVSDHLFVYIQPDFASTPSGSRDATFFAQLRDLYGDVYLDKEKVHRFRVGLSKVPYGWENLQSSQNRMPLDRNDAFNSATRNERDLGVFYYWTPEQAQQTFKYVMDENLKGSGNYGVLGLGVYNGQGGSLQEQNENLHVVGRLTYPFVFENGQIVEVGVQAYTGKYIVFGSAIRPLGEGTRDITPEGTLERNDRAGIRDERVGASFVLYPQPFGFQTEWTTGRGPGLSDDQREVIERALYGGYAMAFYKLDDFHGTWFPFARWSYFKGGYKSERNAPYSRVDEVEVGLEWQIRKEMELTVSYLVTDRTNTTAISSSSSRSEESYLPFDGQVLRFQFQINY